VVLLHGVLVIPLVIEMKRRSFLDKIFFSLLVSEGVIIDSRTDPRSRISLPRLIIIFIINLGENEQPSPSNERFSLISLVNVDDFHNNR
jgi:hypothetical protein